MKQKLLLVFIVVLTYNTMLSQSHTAIPDINFEIALEELGFDDIPRDGQVPTATINTIESIRLVNKNISDLTGIEDFTALRILVCNNNPITKFDLSKNTNLTILQFIFNGIDQIDLSNNNKLEHLFLGRNDMTFIDVSANTNLTTLELDRNKFTTIDLSNLTKLEEVNLSINPIMTIDVSNNIALKKLTLTNTSVSTLDLSLNPSITELNCSKNSSLTSLNLKNNNNNTIREMNANTTPLLSCITVDNENAAMNEEGRYKDWRIDDHIRYAEDCNLDVSINYILVPDENLEKALASIDNKRTIKDGFIPRSAVDTITVLDIQAKGIENLTGIQEFTSLQELNCSDNAIRTISERVLPTTLKELTCSENNISSLNLSALPHLEIVDCSKNELTALDNSMLPLQLKEFTCSQNELSSLSISGLPALEALICSSNLQLTELTVSDLMSLQTLNCNNNALNTLDISKLVALERLDCILNNLTILNTTNNKNLRNINASGNKLKDLDFSANSNIQNVNLPNNLLVSINLKNGSSTNPQIVTLTNNSNLDCIQVDDENAATNSNGKYLFWNKDITASYAETCATLGINDIKNNFSFTTYPNPTNGLITIAGAFKIDQIKLYSTAGILLDTIQSSNHTIDLSAYSKGVYFLYVQSENNDGMTKIVVR